MNERQINLALYLNTPSTYSHGCKDLASANAGYFPSHLPSECRAKKEEDVIKTFINDVVVIHSAGCIGLDGGVIVSEVILSMNINKAKISDKVA